MWFDFLVSILLTLLLSSSRAQYNAFDVVQLTGKLPSPTDKINEDDVNYSLFTPNATKLHFTPDDFNSLDNSMPFKFIVHGWGESSAKNYYKDLTVAYFKKGNYNVVHVNWSVPAAKPYTISARNTVKVGTILGKFIVRLCKASSTNFQNIHILGHSLGSHVAGSAGKMIYKKTGEKLGRITALDPAGPLFEGWLNSQDRTLNKNDAKTVDVVHTDAGFFGFNGSIGTVDFFPNGGARHQPGCAIVKVTDFETTEQILRRAFCSHQKSIHYYLVSINTKQMKGVKCQSWLDFQRGLCRNHEEIVFGENVPLNAKGSYYFKTS